MLVWWWPGLRDRVARWAYRCQWWLGLTPIQLIARRARKVLASDDRILWAGVFGSYARNRQHAKSDIDVIVYCSGTDGTPLGGNIGEELEPRFGRKTDCFTFQPAANRRALRFFDVETAMASQTIYGDASVVERIREEARRILDETIDQLEQIRSHVKEIEQRWHGATERDLAKNAPLLDEILDLLNKACALGARGVAHLAARSRWDVFVYENIDRLAGLVGRCRNDRFPNKGLRVSIVDVGTTIRGAETTLDLRQIADSLEAGRLPPRAMYRHIHC